MGTFDEKSISEAKQKLPNIIREAAKGYEVITRNFKSSSKEKTSIISTEIFEEILDNGYKFYPEIEEDTDGKGFTVSINNLLIHGDGATLFDALYDLAENLMDYSRDFLKKIDFYRQIENRKNHYPYLRRIARYDDIKKVMEVIAECHTGLQQVI
jgi:flavodoxin